MPDIIAPYTHKRPSPYRHFYNNYAQFTLFQKKKQKFIQSASLSNWAEIRRGVPQESVLGPMCFNIFMNALFCHIKYAKLNAYVDDHQIYSSNLDPHALEDCICQEVNVANQWKKQWHDC